MLHPSEAAVEYIWAKLQQAWLSEEARGVYQEMQGLLAAVAHRPQHPGTAGHRRFVQATLQRLRLLQQRQPALDLSREEQQLLAALQQGEAQEGGGALDAGGG